jgi:hypothetical protein
MMESIAQRGKEVTKSPASHCFFYEKNILKKKQRNVTVFYSPADCQAGHLH